MERRADVRLGSRLGLRLGVTRDLVELVLLGLRILDGLREQKQVVALRQAEGDHTLAPPLEVEAVGKDAGDGGGARPFAIFARLGVGDDVATPAVTARFGHVLLREGTRRRRWPRASTQ